MAPSVSSNVAICAGDIGVMDTLGNLQEYFDGVRKTTDNIIYLMGNHEFYHSEYHEALRIAEDFCKDEGIYLLDQELGTENLVIDGIVFWGSTLWTDFNSNNLNTKATVDRNLNDFQVVGFDRLDGKIGNFTAEDSRQVNQITRAKINWEADVVISHHCPVLLEHRRFPINDITYGFCNTGLEEKIKESKIQYWISGHTHDNHYIVDKERFGNTTLISNQQGYPDRWAAPGEEKYEDTGGFDPGLTFEVFKK